MVLGPENAGVRIVRLQTDRTLQAFIHCRVVCRIPQGCTRLEIDPRQIPSRIVVNHGGPGESEPDWRIPGLQRQFLRLPDNLARLGVEAPNDQRTEDRIIRTRDHDDSLIGDERLCRNRHRTHPVRIATQPVHRQHLDLGVVIVLPVVAEERGSNHKWPGSQVCVRIQRPQWFGCWILRNW